MKVAEVQAVYFSPTGNTKKVVSFLAEQLAQKLTQKTIQKTEQKKQVEGALSISTCDITTPGQRMGKREFKKDQLVVFGMPVYAGRVPNKLLEQLQNNFKGNGALVIPVVTFGNRSYDEALKELSLVLEQDGFCPVAAAAVVASHAFSETLAADRPNQQDNKMLEALADQVTDFLLADQEAENDRKIVAVEATLFGAEPVGPYYTPLGLDGKPAKFLKAKPVTNSSLCDQCGCCANVCPMGSIAVDNCMEVPGICIKCQTCIKVCPVQAKQFVDPAFLSHKAMLEQTYTRPARGAVAYFFSEGSLCRLTETDSYDILLTGQKQ